LPQVGADLEAAGHHDRLRGRRRADEFEPARVHHFAADVDIALGPFGQVHGDLHAGNRRFVAGVDFLLRFGERQPLHEHRVDARQLDRAGRRHYDEQLQAAAEARSAVDRVEQVFEPRVDVERRHSDRGHAVVFLVRLFELVAE
jgi:hypothetical protein